MRSLVLGVVALGMVASLPGIAAAKACEDDAAVTAARAAAEDSCGCDTASNHGQFVRCAGDVAKARVAAGTLPKECQSEVVSCAAQSTCGRPGAVTCCHVLGSGSEAECEIEDSAEVCESHSGVTCVGTTRSCCDACDDSGSPGGGFVCGGAPTTTSPPTTATTSSSTTSPTPTTAPVATTSTAVPTTGVPTTEAPTTSSAAPTTSTSTTLIGSPGSAFIDTM